jgi:hypothetical protein
VLSNVGDAMALATSLMSSRIHRTGIVRGAAVSFDEHERLAGAMLAVEAGDVADVKDAMVKIISSAPDATDVALVLLLAISHATDRKLMDEDRLAS